LVEVEFAVEKHSLWFMRDYMNKYGSKLRLTYYEASDGPRVMIFGPSEAEFQELVKLFRSTASSISGSVELSEQTFLVPFHETTVTLTTRPPEGEGCRNARGGLRRVTDRRPAFSWACTPQEWTRFIGLIEGLMQSPFPGHQYLTSYPADDALVVVSKDEYSDDVLTT
jgi:hypothetical protein